MLTTNDLLRSRRTRTHLGTSDPTLNDIVTFRDERFAADENTRSQRAADTATRQRMPMRPASCTAVHVRVTSSASINTAVAYRQSRMIDEQSKGAELAVGKAAQLLPCW